MRGWDPKEDSAVFVPRAKAEEKQPELGQAYVYWPFPASGVIDVTEPTTPELVYHSLTGWEIVTADGEGWKVGGDA